MIPSVRSAGIALFAGLATASPCLAAVGMAPGRGAIGGQIGASYFWAQDDYSEGAEVRFAFSGNFRYVFKPWGRWQISPGFTWAGYSEGTPIAVGDGHHPEDEDKSNNLTLLLPMTAQFQYLHHTKKWHYHLGVGGGFYRVWVENHREVLIDPVTFEKHPKAHGGLTGGLGRARVPKKLPSSSR